jgi:hypothetical protein
MGSNMANSDENFWHNFFLEHQWVISQLFYCPYTIFQSKAYVGGKSISNLNGSICDFIYRNEVTDNIALIEIKTPCTKLVGTKYRNDIYSLSEELSGSINQVLHYKDTLLKEYYALNDRRQSFRAFAPKCIIIIGQTGKLSNEETGTIESFRGAMNGVEIVAYDELLSRISRAIGIIGGKEESTSMEIANDAIDEDDLPF